MARRLHFLLLFFAILIIPNKSEAGYIRGAEIHWDKVAQDTLIVTVRIYRNCNWIGGNSLKLNILSRCGSKSLNLTKGQTQDATAVCPRKCSNCIYSSCRSDYGFTYAEFVGIVNTNSWQKAGCCELNLNVQECCRNWETASSTSNGHIYIESNLNVCQGKDNSSPKFIDHPDFIACAEQDYVSNLGAYDLDRDSLTNRLSDSLVYSLVSPRVSRSSKYWWLGKYSYDKPLTFFGFPLTDKPFPRGFHLDSFSGLLKFRPMKEEASFIVVKIEEYRNGKKIGDVTREFRINVAKCPNNKPPVISAINSRQNSFEVNICESKESCFYVSVGDLDSADTISYSYTTNIPGVPDQPLTPVGTGNIIPICIKPDSTAGKGLYYIDLYVEDNKCPITGKTAQRIKVNINTNAVGKFSLKKEGIFCDKYLFTPLNRSQPLIDSVYWYLDGQKVGRSMGAFEYQFKKVGRHLIEGVVQNCLRTHLSDSVIFSKKMKTHAEKSSIDFLGLGDTTICEGELITIPLTIKSRPKLTVVHWRPVNGNFSASSIYIDTNEMRIYMNNTSIKPAHLSLELTATNKEGCHSEKALSLTVNPTRGLNYFDDIKYCEDKDSAFLLPSIHSVSRWSGDHVVNDTFYFQKNSFSNPLPLYYKGNTGTICLFDTITFEKRKPTKPTWQSDTLVCIGSDDFILTGLGKGQWKGNLVVDPNNPNQATFSPTAKGVHDLTYQKTTAQEENCHFSGHIQVIVDDKVNYISTPDTTICHNSQNIILKSSVKGNWHGLSIENDNEFNPTIKGQNSLIFVTKNKKVCNKKAFITINVVENPNKIKIADTFSVCINNNEEQLLIGNTRNGSWIGKDKVSSTSIINFHSSDYVPGRYDFIYTDIDDTYNCSISDTTVVEINQLPKINISLAQNKVELGKNLKINNLGNQKYTYQWNIQGSSEGKTNDFEPNVKMDELGWFNVRVIVTNPRTTCSDTLALKSVVEVIDPSSIGESYYSNLIDLYPNPSSDQVTIENHGNQAIHFQLYDLSGKTVISIMLKSGNTIIDLSELAKGFYQAQFSLGNSRWMEKVVKK